MKNLKINHFVFVILFFAPIISAQEGWQWAERGGSVAVMSSGDPLTDGAERIIDMVVDSDNNYYFLAEVAGYNFTLGGYDYDSGDYEFDTYNDSAGNRDIFMFSTDNEGNYRWSKVIGGGFEDKAISIGVDSDDNILVSGNVKNIPQSTPVHFDTDSIMSEGSFDDGPENKAAFIIKYNSEGEYQWLLMPGDEDSPGASNYGNAYNLKSVIDKDNIIHNLMYFKEGSHLNGQLIVEEGEIVTAIVNYNSSGELINFLTVDMKPKLNGFYYYRLTYDDDLDRYYIANCRRDMGDYALGIGDYGSEDNSFYLAAVDNQGEILWFHQDHKKNTFNLGDLQLDSSGNVYLTGAMASDQAENPDNDPPPPPNTFAGYSFEPEGTGSGKYDPFLFKLDSGGNLIWGTNADLYSPFPGKSIVIREDEIYLGLGMLHNTWGNITTPGPGLEGFVPDFTIIRFDAQTGEPQELINDQHTLSPDFVTALALDTNNDLVVGGSFGSGTTLFYDTDLAIHNNGADSDFFIAKYGLPALEVQDSQKETVKVYPNPGSDILYLQGPQPITSYTLYDLQGRVIEEDKLQVSEIDISHLETGVYFLKVTDSQDDVERIKVVKE